MARCAAGLLLALAVPCLAATGAADWPTFQCDARRSGSSPDGVIGAPLQPAWQFPANGPVRCQAVVRAGRVFFGTAGHKCFALDAATGQLLWSFITDGEVNAEAATDEAGLVFFPCDDGCVYALDAETGALRWKSAACRTPPETAALEVHAGQDDVFNPPWLLDGPCAMEGASQPTQAVLRAPLLYANGLVFAGSGREGAWGWLNAFDAATGAPRWKRPAHPAANYRHYPAAESSPVSFEDRLYWAHFVFEALDPQTGAGIPGWPVLEGPESGLPYTVKGGAQPAVNEAGLAFVAGNGVAFRTALPAVRLREHSLEKIKTPCGRRTQHRPAVVVHGDAVFATWLDGVPAVPLIGAFNLKTGKPLFEFRQAGRAPLTRTLCRANGLLFAAGEDGMLYAVRAEDSATGRRGELAWSHDLKERISATPAVAHGMLLIGTEQGILYAFKKKETP